MPVNTLRLNHQASSHPNDRIVFIKPLPRPPSDQTSYQLADTFLHAIAAQCLPIMKNHHLSVTTLEEYEPNREFIGRNFNNGEIIQLVLRSHNGSWVPFNMVQMVMMHELAHNMHMNHGKDFWKARNLFSQEMRELWTKNYTGEGFWGSGRKLAEMGATMGKNVIASEELEGLTLCGGTFRSRRRKRKATGHGQDLSWKEKRDRRIEKKFGKNGLSLGENEDRRIMLEVGRKGQLGGKPRVAQSKRGRELRAAAALARFETNKREVEAIKKEEEGVSNGSDEDDEYEDVDADERDATDLNGNRLLDSQGYGMIRVCDDEDADDANVKQEMEELEGLKWDVPHSQGRPKQSETDHGDTATKTPASLLKSDRYPASNGSSDTNPRPQSLYDIPAHPDSPRSPSPTRTATKHTAPDPPDPSKRGSEPAIKPHPTSSAATETLATPHSSTEHTSSKTLSCPICSMTNDLLNPTCVACAHVLDPKKDSRHWRCSSEACRDGSLYINAGDAGICGVCGARKAS